MGEIPGMRMGGAKLKSPTTQASTLSFLLVDVTGQASTIAVSALAPLITDQPDNTSANVGQTATLSLTATTVGSATLSYQWQKYNGSAWANVSAATSTSYTTPTLVEADDQAQYRCLVTNAFGTTTSNTATLTVTLALELSATTVTEGDSVTFNGGGGHLRLGGKWVGVGNSWPLVRRVGVQDAGSYRIYNSAGTAIGSAVTLTVNPSTLVTDDFATISANWSETTGSPTVSGGNLQLTSGKALRRATTNDNVRLYMKFNANGITGNPVIASMVGPNFQIAYVQLFGSSQLRVIPNVQGWYYGGESNLNYDTNNHFSAFTIASGSHELEIHWNKTTKTVQIYIDKILSAAVYNTLGSATTNAQYIPSQCQNIYIGDATNSFTGTVLIDKVEIKQGQYIADQPFTCYAKYAIPYGVGQSNRIGAATGSYSAVTDDIGLYLGTVMSNGTTASGDLAINPNYAPDSTNSDYGFIQGIDIPANHAPLLLNGAVGSTSIAAGHWDSVTVSGTASAATGTTLSDSSKSWTTNQFGDGIKAVKIVTGTGAGQVRSIESNTGTQLTIEPAWTVTPDATSTYQIGGIYRLRMLDGVRRILNCLEGRTDLCVILQGFEGDASGGTTENKYKTEINAIVSEIEAITGTSLFLITTDFTAAFLTAGENETPSYVTVNTWNVSLGDGHANSRVPTVAEYQAGSPNWIHWADTGYRTMGDRIADVFITLQPAARPV